LRQLGQYVEARRVTADAVAAPARVGDPTVLRAGHLTAVSVVMWSGAGPDPSRRIRCHWLHPALDDW
jgi:hypothetical protein